MKNVAVMGLGLMGGSLGLALKSRGFTGRVSGYARRAETRDEALRLGAVDAIYDVPEKAVADADLVVLCVPIFAMPELVLSCRRHLRHRCIVTDVGSTKAELDARIEPLLQGTGAAYIGSHPIAGSEQQGLSASRADLYEGAVVVVTPGRERSAWLEDEVTAFWRGLGARVRIMSAEEHDRIMARTSHLAHLVSALLARTVAREGDPAETGQFCGSGFRDATRIAEGSPPVWHDILFSNRHSIEAELEAFGVELGRLREIVARSRSEDILSFLEDARAKRRSLMRGANPDENGGGNER
jgi:prephenate dehydrogenase